MRVITEFEACHSDFDKLYNNSWSGAIDTLNMVREYGLAECGKKPSSSLRA